MTTQPEALRLAEALTPPTYPAWVMHIPPPWNPRSDDVRAAAAELRRLHAECEAVKKELETERVRLAACGVIAMSNTPESAARARHMLPMYRSASADDVANAVDREMALRGECEALRATQSDTLLRLLCDLRFALGDNGARMQHDLVEYARGMRADAERYRWLRDKATDWYVGPSYSTYNDVVCEGQYLDLSGGGVALDSHIDAARAAKEQA